MQLPEPEVIPIPPDIPPEDTQWQWIYGTVVSSTFLMYGMEAGWISPMSIILKSDKSPLGYPITNSSLSWLASIVAFVAAFFVPIFSYLIDDYGRKWLLFASTFPQALSIILRILFPNLIILGISRALCGLSASGCFSIVSIYLREISQRDIIAAVGSLPVLMQNAGILIIYLIGTYFDYFTVLWMMLSIPAVLMILLSQIPESPDFLVKQGLMDKAHATVAFLRGLKPDDQRVKAEVELLKKLEDQFAHLPKTNICIILKDKAWRRGFILVLILFTTHAWNGAFVIITYATTILCVSEHGGLTFVRPELQSLCFPVVMITASVGFVFIADKWGRRHLQAGAYAISATAFTILGLSHKLYEWGYSTPGWLPLLCMTVTCAMYSGGIRPLPCVIIAEMFSFKVRAKVMGILITYGWLCVSTQIFSYGPLVDSFGLAITFFLYAVINIIGIIFALLVPETKGRNPEEMRNILMKQATPKDAR